MQRQGRLVQNNAGLVRPEPSSHELFVLPSRKVHKPVDASLRPRHTTSQDVLAQQVRRIPGLSRLFRRHVACLSGCGGEELIPTRPRVVNCHHAQNVTVGSVLCKETAGLHRPSMQRVARMLPVGRRKHRHRQCTTIVRLFAPLRVGCHGHRHAGHARPLARLSPSDQLPLARLKLMRKGILVPRMRHPVARTSPPRNHALHSPS